MQASRMKRIIFVGTIVLAVTALKSSADDAASDVDAPLDRSGKTLERQIVGTWRWTRETAAAVMNGPQTMFGPAGYVPVVTFTDDGRFIVRALMEWAGKFTVAGNELVLQSSDTKSTVHVSITKGRMRLQFDELSLEYDRAKCSPTDQRYATIALQNCGAKVDFDENGDVTSVLLEAADLAQENLELFAHFPFLQAVSLESTTIADTWLAVFDNIPIMYLSLKQTDIGDDGLRHVCQPGVLTGLDLYGTRVTDEGLRHLRNCPSLTHLDLSFTKLTGHGLEHLQTLQQLQNLNLSHSDVTDAGLAHLPDLPLLFTLNLAYTDVSDVGVERLASHPLLMRLDLRRTNVGDDAIEHLIKLKRLQRVSLSRSQVTEAGKQRLRAALPDAKIP